MNSEKKLERIAARYADHQRKREPLYSSLIEAIRDANGEGVSYDRIATITGLSKTQVRRICLERTG